MGKSSTCPCTLNRGVERHFTLHTFSVVTACRVGFAHGVSTGYAIAPIFVIRIAGAAFEAVTGLATPETARAARNVPVKSQPVLRKRGAAPLSPEQTHLTECLERELATARRNLVATTRKLLPAYLVFAATGTENLIRGDEMEALSPRNNRARSREQHLLLYLQRLCTKNDTFSEFGPTLWGRADAQSGLTLAPKPGMARREAFFERWVALAIAAAMNNDSEVHDELRPRVHPNIQLNGNEAWMENGDVISLSDEERQIIERCNGRTPIRELNIAPERIDALVKARLLQCEIAVPALDPYAFNALRRDVGDWLGKAREKWEPLLNEFANIPIEFCRNLQPERRQELLGKARFVLDRLGACRESGNRALYAATNPIAEECSRDGFFRINQTLLNEPADQAAPWIDLWRDTYAFVASRVAAALRSVFQRTVGNGDTISLPRFLRVCAEGRLPLQGPGLVAPAVIAFQEVKAAFRERLQPHADQPEYELTIDDCHVVRNNFKYPKFDEYTFPSADLQLSAVSPEAVERGEYEWILGELHPPVAMMHHCMFWSCPDKTHFQEACAAGVFKRPNFHFGIFAADFTAHTTVRFFDALPDFWYFVAPQRGNSKWQTVRPADADVYVDKQTGDVALRERKTGKDLGSFARNWIIPLGFHPFQFGISPHTPRLRCGRVIVQRRTWTVTAEELRPGNYTGVSRDLVVAIEELRAKKGWPRFIYIRPSEGALRRSGAEGRDKDTKPIFIDLESYLLLEIFHRWLTKAGELEVTEMLPDPDHLLWKETDGHRTFELRTLIVPRK